MRPDGIYGRDLGGERSGGQIRTVAHPPLRAGYRPREPTTGRDAHRPADEGDGGNKEKCPAFGGGWHRCQISDGGGQRDNPPDAPLPQPTPNAPRTVRRDRMSVQ